MTERTELRELLLRIRSCTFLVIGDLYLDRYIFGQPARVSREAPIMVLEETRLEDRPGGGCAPALALAELGASVQQIGVVGNDEAGEKLLHLLAERGIGVEGVLTDPDRPTTVKTRIVAEGAFNLFPQQVSRIDRQDRSALGTEIEARLVQQIQSVSPAVDALLISDYRSGVVTPNVVGAVRSEHGLGTVDSQGALRDFGGLDLIKCNQAEAESVLGRQLSDPVMRRKCLPALQTELETARLIVTLGAEGAALSSRTEGYREFPPPEQQFVFDVTGAGDTVIALLTGAVTAGGSDSQALTLAQIAAGIVIARWGNAQASVEDILAEIGSN